MKFLAEKFRKLREERGYTQLQVAESMEVSIATISRLENEPSKLKFEYILGLADYYGVPLRKLFSEYEKDLEDICSEVRVQVSIPMSLSDSKLFFEIAKLLQKTEENNLKK